MRLVPDEALAAVTIYQEAEGESYAVKVAVAETIRNRMQRKYSSDGTVAGTVLRRLQFSGWNADAANRIRSLQIDDQNPIVMDCVKAWAAAQSGSDSVPGAVLFYATTMKAPPTWALDRNFICQIGKVRFYRD
jgi:N-acetylmuramoyl-L-alanine amidase